RAALGLDAHVEVLPRVLLHESEVEVRQVLHVLDLRRRHLSEVDFTRLHRVESSVDVGNETEDDLIGVRVLGPAPVVRIPLPADFHLEQTSSAVNSWTWSFHMTPCCRGQVSSSLPSARVLTRPFATVGTCFARTGMYSFLSLLTMSPSTMVSSMSVRNWLVN